MPTLTLGGPPCFGNGQPLDGMNGGCGNYYTLAYKTSNGNLPSGVPTTINFHTIEAENPAGFFNLASDIATIPYDGMYTVTATVETTLAAAGIYYGAIEINTVSYSLSSMDAIAAVTANLTMAITRYMTAGDQIRVRAQQNTGFLATIQGVQRRTCIAITSACIP